MVPQGWKGEFNGWEPAAAWARTLSLASQAEELGFESLWVFDHFQDRKSTRLNSSHSRASRMPSSA